MCTKYREKNPLKTLPCRRCGKEFLQKRTDNVYCSFNCKDKDGKKRRGWKHKGGDWYKYKKHRKDHCERCGFIPEHICQLDVDHINGISTDHSIDNLQTLCANCHRLKTYRNKDWEDKEKEELVI